MDFHNLKYILTCDANVIIYVHCVLINKLIFFFYRRLHLHILHGPLMAVLFPVTNTRMYFKNRQTQSCV
jgi:hypothetical protein